MELQVSQNSQNNIEKEEQSRRSHTSWFQNLLKSNGNQDSLVVVQDRHIDQRNGITRPEIKPYV